MTIFLHYHDWLSVDVLGEHVLDEQLSVVPLAEAVGLPRAGHGGTAWRDPAAVDAALVKSEAP